MADNTEKTTVTSGEIITRDDTQTDPIFLDLDNNQIRVNSQFQDTLAKVADIVKRGNTILKIDINDVSEDEMSDLNKEIKPITQYEKTFADFRKYVKKSLEERDNKVLGSLDKVLTDAGFDQIPDMTKKLRQLQKDFKSNRANQRWAELQEMFEAQMDLYPELRQYAPNTLGSFAYFRIHHADLVSEAKTKPVTAATIKELNEDVHNYSEDMQHLLGSTLQPAYYNHVVEQYAAEPTTNNMLSLVNTAMTQQIKDQNLKLIQMAEVKAKAQLNKLWYNNEKINALLERIKPDQQPEAEFTNNKLKHMKAEGNAILSSLQLESFIDQDAHDVDSVKLQDTLKTLIQAAFGRMRVTLEKERDTFTIKPVEEKKPEETKPTPKPEVPFGWLLDYLQASNWQAIHDNNKIKVAVLRDLFENITNKQSVWRQHIKNNDQIMETVAYITNM